MQSGMQSGTFLHLCNSCSQECSQGRTCSQDAVRDAVRTFLHLCNSCSQDAVRVGRAVRMQSGMQSVHFSTCVIRAVRNAVRVGRAVRMQSGMQSGTFLHLCNSCSQECSQGRTCSQDAVRDAVRNISPPVSKAVEHQKFLDSVQ